MRLDRHDHPGQLGHRLGSFLTILRGVFPCFAPRRTFRLWLAAFSAGFRLRNLSPLGLCLWAPSIRFRSLPPLGLSACASGFPSQAFVPSFRPELSPQVLVLPGTFRLWALALSPSLPSFLRKASCSPLLVAIRGRRALLEGQLARLGCERLARPPSPDVKSELRRH